MIKSIVTSYRNWKTEFFFVSGFWAGCPLEVFQDPFPPYTRELGNLCLEGMLIVVTLLIIVFILVGSYLIMFILFSFFICARRPHLSRFYIEQIQKACLYTDRAFHSLISLQRLAIWGLGPKPSAESLAHELIVHRRKLSCRPSLSLLPLSLFLFIFIFIFILNLSFQE